MTVHIKRVGRSKLPLIHQLPAMADNLASLPNIEYANVEIRATNYGYGNAGFNYRIAIQPGLDGTDCSLHDFSTWPKCQNFYFQLMKGE